MSDASGIVVLIGRILFALVFINTGVMFHMRQSGQASQYAAGMRFPVPAIAGWPTGLWMAAGGLSVALGIWPDVGALMIGLFAVTAALGFHRFWAVDDPGQKMVQNQLFFRNVIITSAVLVMVGLFATVGDGLRYAITEPLLSF